MARHLLQAICAGDEKLAKEIIRGNAYGCIDSQTSRRDGTALFFCCSRGQLELVTLLVKRGACLEARTKWSATPLHAAVDNNHLEVVRYLINVGADINARTQRGDTPLHLAAFRGHTDLVCLLVQLGADVTRVNEWNLTALNEAARYGHEDVKQFLQAVAEYRPNSRNNGSTTDSSSHHNLVSLSPPTATTNSITSTSTSATTTTTTNGKDDTTQSTHFAIPQQWAFSDPQSQTQSPSKSLSENTTGVKLSNDCTSSSSLSSSSSTASASVVSSLSSSDHQQQPMVHLTSPSSPLSSPSSSTSCNQRKGSNSNSVDNHLLINQPTSYRIPEESFDPSSVFEPMANIPINNNNNNNNRCINGINNTNNLGVNNTNTTNASSIKNHDNSNILCVPASGRKSSQRRTSSASSSCMSTSSSEHSSSLLSGPRSDDSSAMSCTSDVSSCCGDFRRMDDLESPDLLPMMDTANACNSVEGRRKSQPAASNPMYSSSSSLHSELSRTYSNPAPSSLSEFSDLFNSTPFSFDSLNSLELNSSSNACNSSSGNGKSLANDDYNLVVPDAKNRHHHHHHHHNHTNSGLVSPIPQGCQQPPCVKDLNLLPAKNYWVPQNSPALRRENSLDWHHRPLGDAQHHHPHGDNGPCNRSRRGSAGGSHRRASASSSYYVPSRQFSMPLVEDSNSRPDWSMENEPSNDLSSLTPPSLPSRPSPIPSMTFVNIPVQDN